ncbi:D-xylose isomerase [Faunimonas pinastri]|uniref:Xylose isomerase n=1 Tax=Faunimonas pinastri TaxID=1855383 RepID=A0A1H9KX21_9HYPH|nr:xylose isomerase [Faunimonas pinastri]SER03495.1 D-xylose isomerase [Faunimonas pinastri]
MSSGFFKDIQKVTYKGPDSKDPLSFRFYDPDRMVMGKRMADHLRFAVAYWHSFAWPGSDPFGGQTFDRPWFRGDDMEHAKLKAEVAFELFTLLGVPFFTFHDRDIAPEGKTLAESNRNVREIADIFAKKIDETGVRLLWGTANLFSNRRFMAGAATNPDPDLFIYAAAQVKNVLEITHELGGENYVLWGGREGYETLLNTDMGRELDQLGRFLTMVVEHKNKIGFKGQILIEPKPKEPTKHQYDFDVASIYGMLQRYGLENEVKTNLEQNHAILAGHSFQHEIHLANALGLFGSLDINRGDDLLGWDTDQFAMNVPEMTLAFYEILKAGGFTSGGMNFDAKIRRQSIDPEDLLYAHVGSMDAIARGLEGAAKMLEEGDLKSFVDERYSGWDSGIGQEILKGEKSLDDLAKYVEEKNLDPQPKSGRQEYLESMVNRYS